MRIDWCTNHTYLPALEQDGRPTVQQLIAGLQNRFTLITREAEMDNDGQALNRLPFEDGG